MLYLINRDNWTVDIFTDDVSFSVAAITINIEKQIKINIKKQIKMNIKKQIKINTTDVIFCRFYR